jgi:nicotinamidase-related amidase
MTTPMPSIELDPKTTALVLIDLQAGIVARQTAPYPSNDVVSRCADLAARFRRHGAAVVYVRVDLLNFIMLPVDSPLRDPNGPPPPASASELVPEAGRQPGEALITKRHWSAFINTELEARLRERGIRTIVLGGIATNFGVESTARDAAALGFNVVLVEDAMTSFVAEHHRFAVEAIFPRLGRVRRIEQIAFAK